MWDGRETIQPIKGLPAASFQALEADLMDQALNATLGHAQATAPPTEEQLRQIVAMETGLYTAQSRDDAAGWLRGHGGLGGPSLLADQNFYIGINDTLGNDPFGIPFSQTVFTLYDRWAGGSHHDHDDGWDRSERARRAVARGEKLFNTKQFQITDVKGLNDALNIPSITGTCTSCHNAPDVGDHSVSLPLNIGLTDVDRRTPDLPLYTLQNRTTGETVQTTDPGRALITGKWADIGKFKGPVLRGLAARPPYFHNGSAAALEDVVDFYDKRFHIDLTHREKEDLAAFLRTL
jgi:hypothetical protein